MILPTQSRIVITGGLGFIGSNLALRLADTGIPTLIIDNLGPNYGGNLSNITSHLTTGEIKVNISDIRDQYSLRPLLTDAKTIFSLAGQSSHMDSMRDPFTDLDINCKAQLSILEICKDVAPGSKIIFTSTRQIYGKPQYLPVDESHPLRPVDVNGINKLAGEHYHILYSQLYDIRSTVLRLTNTYGPRMRIKDSRQTFLGVWVKQLLMQQQFEIWGGHQLRDYTYIDDCVELLHNVYLRDVPNSSIFNVGASDGPFTLLETAETLVAVARELGLPLLAQPFVVKNYPEDRKSIDIGSYYSDCNKAKLAFEWIPRITLREGLARTLIYYKDNLRHYVD